MASGAEATTGSLSRSTPSLSAMAVAKTTPRELSTHEPMWITGGNGPPKPFASPMAVSTAFSPSPQTSSTLAWSINPWRMSAPAPHPVARTNTLCLSKWRATVVKLKSWGTFTLLQPAKRQTPQILPATIWSINGLSGSALSSFAKAWTRASTEKPVITFWRTAGTSVFLPCLRLKASIPRLTIFLAFSMAFSSA